MFLFKLFSESGGTFPWDQFDGAGDNKNKKKTPVENKDFHTDSAENNEQTAEEVHMLHTM